MAKLLFGFSNCSNEGIKPSLPYETSVKMRAIISNGDKKSIQRYFKYFRTGMSSFLFVCFILRASFNEVKSIFYTLYNIECENNHNHLKNNTKNKLTAVRPITSDKFNKSATLDIESNLIKYFPSKYSCFFFTAST